MVYGIQVCRSSTLSEVSEVCKPFRRNHLSIYIDHMRITKVVCVCVVGVHGYRDLALDAPQARYHLWHL